MDAQVRTINPGEELVGVYGVKGRAKWFTSLGFIVCKKIYPKTVGIDETPNVVNPWLFDFGALHSKRQDHNTSKKKDT